MSLILHELVHFFVSLLIAFFVIKKYKSLKFAIIVMVVGMFLDIDHIFDIILASGNFKEIITGHYFATSQKAYVLLHSWELLIPWWGYICWKTSHHSSGSKNNLYPLGWAVTLAFVGHLLIDQFSYNTHLFTYFISYKIFVNFDLSKLFG